MRAQELRPKFEKESKEEESNMNTGLSQQTQSPKRYVWVTWYFIYCSSMVEVAGRALSHRQIATKAGLKCLHVKAKAQ